MTNLEKSVRRKALHQCMTTFLMFSPVPFFKKLWIFLIGKREILIELHFVFAKDIPLTHCMRAMRKDMAKEVSAFLPAFLPDGVTDYEHEFTDDGEKYFIATHWVVRIDEHPNFDRQLKIALGLFDQFKK